MNDFLCIALLAGIFLMLAIIADVLSRILDCLDDDWDEENDDDDEDEENDDEDDDWPEPDPNH